MDLIWKKGAEITSFLVQKQRNGRNSDLAWLVICLLYMFATSSLTSLMETWFPPATTEKIGTVVNVMLKHSISRFYYEQPKQYQAKVEKILDIRTASLNRNC